MISAKRESVQVIRVQIGNCWHCLTDAEAEELIDSLKGALLNGLRIGVSIKAVVSGAFGVTVSELESSVRKEHFVVARWICYRLMRERGMTLEAIGKEFHKDHGTVIHGLREMQNRKGMEHALQTIRELINRSIEPITKPEKIS